MLSTLGLNTTIHGQAPRRAHILAAYTSSTASARSARDFHQQPLSCPRLGLSDQWMKLILMAQIRTCGGKRECRSLMISAFPSVLLLLLCLPLSAAVTSAQDRPTRFEVAPVFSNYHAHKFATLRPDRFEFGVRFTWNWFPHLAIEGEYDSTLKQEDLQSSFEGGHFSQGLFGIKSGMRWKSWGAFVKFRPGFISFSDAITSANFTTGKITFGRLTDPAFDAGGGAEFLLSRHWLFRYDASALIVHQGPVSFVNSSGQRVTFVASTFSNFESEVGVAFRF